jgi:hypothetical protein
VLSVTPQGFDDHRTLPVASYNTRFYNAQVQDSDRDGTYDIRTMSNDCFESCAGGKVSETLFAWSGRDFLAVAPAAPQLCGSLSERAPSGVTYIARDVTVVGVSCYEVYGHDGPSIVRQIVVAQTPSSGEGEVSASGYRCTIGSGSAGARRYRCTGKGTITFERQSR